MLEEISKLTSSQKRDYVHKKLNQSISNLFIDTYNIVTNNLCITNVED
jgi:hypothetical protein